MTERMSLIEEAETAYGEFVGANQDEADERFEDQRQHFLDVARKTARVRLGSAADELEWTYTLPDDLPADTEEAVAPLGQGRPEYLRYRYTVDEESGSFELVQPCHACGHDRINEVSGLTKLGELLASKGGDR